MLLFHSGLGNTTNFLQVRADRVLFILDDGENDSDSFFGASYATHSYFLCLPQCVMTELQFYLEPHHMCKLCYSVQAYSVTKVLSVKMSNNNFNNDNFI